MKKIFSLAGAFLLSGTFFASSSIAGEKTATEFYDFASFVAGGAPSLTTQADTIWQEGNNATSVFLVNDPTGTTSGETLKLKNRFAVNANSSAGYTMRWMWRAPGQPYQNGLAGNWNGKGVSVNTYNLSVMNLLEGDSISFAYTMQSGKTAELHVCSAGVLATTEGVSLDADAIVASGIKYVMIKDGNLDLYDTNNNMAIQNVTIVTEPEKIEVTDVFDFAAFVAGGAPTLTLQDEAIEQTGTNALPVYIINDPTATNSGATLKLKGRFAVNAGSTAAVQMRWMWRAPGNAWQNGLAGNWNNNGAAVSSYNLSVLNLEEGDSIQFNYTIRSGKPAELHICSSDVLVGTDETALEAEAVVVSGTKYIVKKAGNLDLYVTNDNFSLQSVAITYKTMSLPAPTIVSEGEEYGAVKVTVDGAEGTVYYSIDGGEARIYTEPFYLTKSSDVSAWYESNGVESVVADVRVRAGVIATPKVTVTKVFGVNREVSVATATGAATLVINEVATDNNFVETISESKDYVVVAKTFTEVGETRYEMVSDTAKVSIEAGTTIKLAAPTTLVSANYHYNVFDVLVNANQSSVLCQPVAKVVYVNPQGETETINSGDIVRNVTLGKFTAKAIAEGYDDSDVTTRWLKAQPAYDTLAVYDFQNDPELVGATMEIGPEEAGTAWEIGNQRYQKIYTLTAPAKMAGKFAMQGVANGANNGWWLRKHDTNMNYTGLCEGNSPRSAALLNLGKGAVAVFHINTNNPDQVNFQGGGQNDGEWTVDIQGSDVYVTMTKAGNLGFCLPKRTNPDVYIGSIIVLQSDAQTYDPSAKKAGAKGKNRFIELSTTTAGADIFFSLNEFSEISGELIDPVPVTPITSVFAKVKHVVASLDEVPAGFKGYSRLVSAAYNKVESVSSQEETVPSEIEGGEPTITVVYDTVVSKVPAVYEYYYYNNEVEEITADKTTGFFHYTGPFLISSATKVAAYAEYQGLLSETPVYEFTAGEPVKLNTPVFTWANETATFNASIEAVTKIDGDDAEVAADLYYTVAGGEEKKVTGTIVVPAANYGWMQLVARADGYEDSDITWRYADGRESYAEPYLALYNASDTIPANIDKMGDVEIKAGLDLDSVPAAFKSAGRIYFHVATTNYYGNLVAPFAMSNTDLESGAVAVLDGNGKKLTRGTEYVVYNMVANTVGTPTSGTFANNELVNSSLLEGDGMVRTGNITAKGNFLVKVAEDIAGKDLILQSKAAQQFPTSTISFVQPTAEGSWKLVANGRLETTTADFDVYVLNETGTKFEKSRTVAPWQTAILLDAASTETIAEFVLVDNAVGIGNVDAPVFEAGAIYDLQGRKVQKIQKGQIYIINGARFMTK